MARTSVLFLCVLLLGSCLPSLSPDSAGNPQDESSAGGQGTGSCGSGSWQPGSLEIHHIDAGEAVATLFVSPSGRSMLIDAGEAAWDEDEGAKLVGSYVRRVLGCSQLDYVVLSHFHLDHAGFPGYGGIWHLVHRQGFTIGKFLHRDLERFAGAGGATLAAWRAYLQSDAAKILHPEVAILGSSQVQMGGEVAFAVLAVDANGWIAEGDFGADASPPDENDYSLATLLRFGHLDYFTAGDLSGETLVASGGGYSYHDAETRVARFVKDVDVYRVSHHGSSHASNATLLAQIDPEVAIIQVGDSDKNGHPTQSTVDRLLATSTLYLTEHGDPSTDLRAGKVAGDVILRTFTGIEYTINNDRFVASDPRRVDSDGDGYFAEADPDDSDPMALPFPQGGCDATYQICP